jgi:putative dimethyl sulfoxide reductase chaperone
MIPVSEMTTLLSNRTSLYSLLARLYLIEVDQPLLDQMIKLNLAAGANEPDIDDGYRRLANYLSHLNPDAVTDLAVDYARVFLSAGIENGEAAFPYESVYTSPQHLIMQEARDQVLGLYYAHGLDRADNLDVPEDHIALELEFMGRLCLATQDALVANDLPAAAKALETQKSFLEQHLGKWVPYFCNDVCRYARTDFYPAVAKITSGLLKMDAPLIDQLIAEIYASQTERVAA